MDNRTLPGFFDDLSFTIVDVGARDGLAPQWAPFSTYINAVLVEPDPEEAKIMQRNAAQSGLRKVHVIPKALSDKKGKLVLRLAQTGANSSVLAANMDFLSRFPNSERFSTREEFAIECDTLDGQLASLGIDQVDFLKLDVEGYESQVIAGGQNALASCFGLSSEASLAERYLGNTHFCEVNKLASDSGMVLADMERKWWLRGNTPLRLHGLGQIIFLDCIWIKDPLTLSTLTKVSLQKLLFILVVHSFYDWAYEAAGHAVKLGLMSKNDLSALDGWISSRGRYANPLYSWLAKSPHFPMKRSLARFFGIASQCLGGNLYGHHFQTDGTAWNRKWRWEQ